jgi:hypothetical protein
VTSLYTQPQTGSFDFRGLPCPCCGRSRLEPISLMEALGCNRCPQIFVVDEADRLIAQPSRLNPSIRIWRWTGQQWRLVRNMEDAEFLTFCLGVGLLILGWIFAVRFFAMGVQILYWVGGIFLLPWLLLSLRNWLSRFRG